MHEELKRTSSNTGGDSALRTEVERLQRENNSLHTEII